MNRIPPYRIELRQGGIVLQYDVRWHERTVGRVEVIAKGLYCHILCRCQKLNGIFRLLAQTENGDIPIGILCPGEGGFLLERAIPMRKIDCDRLSFILAEKNENTEFYPIDPNKPCPIIERLEEARFAVRNGIPGLILRDDSGDRP